MNTDDRVDQLRDEIPYTDEILESLDGITPFEDVCDTDSDEASTKKKKLAQNFSSPVLRYLLQLCIHWPGDKDREDAPQSALDVLSRSISTLGGRIEHHWSTPWEYDLVLVIGLHSHAVSIETYEMALRGTAIVKSVRITPLLQLDKPPEEPERYTVKQIVNNCVASRPTRASDFTIDEDQLIDAFESIEFEGD